MNRIRSTDVTTAPPVRDGFTSAAQRAACTVLLACLALALHVSRAPAQQHATRASSQAVRGTLLIVGGGEQPPDLVKEFVTPVRFIVFPGEGHTPSKYVHQRRKVDEDMAWFDQYLFGTTQDVTP